MAQQTLDYGELFCEAIDTIVKERLSHVSYDRTILCTIVDDSLREQGVYTVTENNSTKFTAYTNNTSYRKGHNVYVQIPGGDWNQQKIIVSKKTDTDIEPYVYQKPFDSLVDLTGNLVSNGSELNKVGLTANAEGEGLETITLWSYNAAVPGSIISDTGPVLSGYTRLGIQAGFQAWLESFYDEDGISRKVVEGEYGLRLEIHAEGDILAGDIVATQVKGDEEQKPQEPTTEVNTAIYELYLTSAEMNGNPYNFQSFFTQEQIFDISSVGKIVSMELQFYQVPGSFKDADGIEMPFKDFLGNIIKPNIYINDVYINLGYDVNSFDEEMVQIYTLDSPTYSRTSDPISNNNKNIYLRWVQKQADGSFKSITEKNDLEFELRWYRYKLGNSSADQYSGVYWKYLSTQETTEQDNFYEIKDEDWNKYNKANIDDAKIPSFFSTWLIPDITVSEEQVKAVLIYNNKVYHSNIIKFTNENEVINKPTIDAIQALSIQCDDNTFGNYRIYNLGNMLLDHAQSKVIRTLKPYFKSSEDGEDAKPEVLTKADSIEWIIPVKNTMIVLDGIEYEDDTESVKTEDGAEYIKITRVSGEDQDISEINTQNYRIRSYYSQNYSNNTIQCRVTRDKVTYTATKELTFGPAGTTGTDVTLVLDFDDAVAAVTVPETEGGDAPATFVTARLYDYKNNEIDISNDENYKITWGWKNSLTDIDKNELITIETNGMQSYQCELKAASGITQDNIIDNFHILQATLTGWGDYDLIAYLPIPIRTSTEYNYITGTTQVLYDSSGEVLDYFKNPYILFDKDGNVVPNVDWSTGNKVSDILTSYTYINNGIDGEEKYTPQIYHNSKADTYSLQPLSIYVEGTSKYLSVTAQINKKIVWSQPILILQNRYPAAMVNAWDGALKIDDKNNAILAAKFVAGRKENDNTFTGVMMGDWQEEDAENAITEHTGIYGFNKGEQAFGFKDDGTAFIGKPGAGRLIFNGDKSVITSNAYASEAGGMALDFDDGSIELRSPNDASVEGFINIDASETKTPLKIGSKFNVDWNGKLTATDGVFTGEINATSGKIGGWYIKDGTLSSGLTNNNASGLIINSTGNISGNYSFKDETGWLIDSGGNAYFNNITANKGTIAGCPITSNTMGSTNYGTTTGWQIKSDGTATFNSVTASGEIHATSGSFPAGIMTGQIISSQISSNAINANHISAGAIKANHLSADAITAVKIDVSDLDVKNMKINGNQIVVSTLNVVTDVSLGLSKMGLQGTFVSSISTNGTPISGVIKFRNLYLTVYKRSITLLRTAGTETTNIQDAIIYAANGSNSHILSSYDDSKS